MSIVISIEGLDEIVQALHDEGRAVYGPVVKDGVITHDVLSNASQLPQGWTEEQEGGTYRLTPTGTPEVFAYSSPSTSWKRFLFPERTLLVRSSQRDGLLEIEEPEHRVKPAAFFGIRSCDLAALGILDRVFVDDEHADPEYASRRSDVFIVAAACAHPGNTCFCVSMDTGPSPRGGFDLSVAELHEGDQHDFLITSGSDRGERLLATITGRKPEPADHDRAEQSNERASAAMIRHLNPADPPIAAASLDHPQWDDVAERCLACGNCTMVCPTCFCSTTEDHTSIAGDEAERWRVWDSCFTLDFTHLPEGSVRSSTKSRYRQWLLHKLVTWHDQFDMSGCVGCGRCITWCPVGIDLTAEIAALATRQKADS